MIPSFPQNPCNGSGHRPADRLRWLVPAVTLLSMVVLALLAPTRASGQDIPAVWPPELSLEAIHARGVFTGASFPSGTWFEPLTDGDTSEPLMWMLLPGDSQDGGGSVDVVLKNLRTGRTKTVVPGEKLIATDTGKPIRAEKLEVSSDGSRLLLFSDSEVVWRTRSAGFFYVVDRDVNVAYPLSERSRGLQQFATFSPDGSKVAFVRNRDLFVVDLETGSETRITSDGSAGGIINGTSDWVYEEEFGLQKAFAWSPDGSQLAWLVLDESHTKAVTLTDWRDSYPDTRTFRYPKAGERNAEARVCTSPWKDPSPECFETDTWDPGHPDVTAVEPDRAEYLPRLGWTPGTGSRVWMLRLNRNQDRLDLLLGTPGTMQVDTALSTTSEGWVEIRDPVAHFLPDGRHVIWFGEKDGFRRLVLHDMQTGTQIPLTTGTWDVATFNGVTTDGDGTHVWFTAGIDRPAERQLFRVLLPPEGFRVAGKRQRMTWGAGVHLADVSPDGSWFIDRVSNVGTPPIWSLVHTASRRTILLEENKRLRKLMAIHDLPVPEFTTLPAADGSPLHAWVLKPSNFDSTRAHPLLMYVYGGPDSQTVIDAWGGPMYVWHAYLAERMGIVVASVDNRGTGGRGRSFAHQVRGRLGQLEMADQVSAARALGARSWIDADRMGIWGWSYGGYSTLMALLADGGSPFHAGIAVAPVTDWRLYDSIYTERYLSTPQMNPTGYRLSAPLDRAGLLRHDQRLLLVHGDADDNVHAQHTLQMAAALQQADRMFDLMIYPGRTHSLAGDGTRLHLFSMITRYIREHLMRTFPTAPPRSDAAPDVHPGDQ